MSDLSSFEERQEDEVEFLKAVFPNSEDFKDLRLNDTWKIHRPPEILLTLVPQKSMGGSGKDQRPLSIKLHSKYTIDYPDSPPILRFEDPQGLTQDQVKELKKEVKKLSRERVGEVMMLEIAQHVMSFLHKLDRPAISLHQEMVMRQKEEEREKVKKQQTEREQYRMKYEEEHRKVMEEYKRKEEEIKRLDMNSDEDSSEQDHYSSADESLASSIRAAPPLTSTPSLQSSKYFSQVESAPQMPEKDGVKKLVTSRRAQKKKEIQIKKGKLLGDSMTGGYSVYVGMEIDSGDLLALYEWSFQSKKKLDSRRTKQVDSIKQEFEGFIHQGIHHPRLVQFMNMTYSSDYNKITVELVTEYVGGGNVSTFLRAADSGPVTGSILSHYSKQLLEALECLHLKGIVHNNISPFVVYFDGGPGNLKLGGSNVIKRLSDLHYAINNNTRLPSQAVDDERIQEKVWPAGFVDLKGGKKGDVFKLGMVILCLATGKLETYPPIIPEHLPSSLKDFLSKCVDSNEQRRLPVRDLLYHPFIVPNPQASQQFTTTSPCFSISLANKHTPIKNKPTRDGPMHFQRSDSIFGSPLKPSFKGKSRLETEFEELEVLGSGGFGDVIKVRHYLDARLYAIKRIQKKSDVKIMNKITREVELLSQLNHENVVRYYNAWIETFSEEDYKRLSGTHLEEYDSETSSSNSEGDSELLESRSIEFQNGTFSDEESYSNEETSSDSFQSAEEDIIFQDITFAHSPSRPGSYNMHKVDTRGRLGKYPYGHETDEDGVFMDEFSDNSGGSNSEGRNILGDLETQVMNLSLSKFRFPTTESSDTVVFADSSTAPSKPLTIEKNERKKDRKKLSSSGQVQYLYIQMEYCENETLRQLIDSGNLHISENKVWRLFREIVEGLEHIHSKGMIHRDLKPGNIFLNSSGHIKIGDFGLAISHKHPINKQSSAVMNASVNLLDGDTGLVGTALYMAPELLKNQLKYTQKVDTYSLGIIFFEMCHPPLSTAMERHKMLLEIRRPDIVFPLSFDTEKAPKQKEVIEQLLNHNPHERPSSKQLLQNPLLPLKMEDEELQEVLLRTLQSTNSTRYRNLIEELFSQDGVRVSEFSYFLDPQESKRRSHSLVAKSKFSFRLVLLQQLVHSKLVSIFTHHGASSLAPPLLSVKGKLFSKSDSAAQFMDRNGTVVVLPHDHRIPFARYICHQDISYLKRYLIAPVFRENRVLGSHPREHYECQFDIVSPTPGSFIPDAEVMYVVSEIINEVPGLQDFQFSIWLNHTSLLSSILTYCSIPEEKHSEVKGLLHKMVSGHLKSPDFIKKLSERNIKLSPLASNALLKFMQSEVLFESKEAKLLLEPLFKDRSTEVASQSSQAWQEITNVVSLFRQFGAKEQVYVHPGLSHGSQHFSGVIFQYLDTSSSTNTCLRRNKRLKRTPLAIGGRYDKLLGKFHQPIQNSVHPGVSVVGVTVMTDLLLGAALNAYHQETCPINKCLALVCWLGRESLQKECLGLVRDLWAHGISADILYESMEKDSIEDIQEFCREFKIPHVVILRDRALYFERKQVRLRILEATRVVEKLVTITELMDFFQQKQKQKHHIVEKSDSIENKEPIRASGSYTSDGQSATVPQVNITVVITGKITGHMRRRYHDQAINKMLPLFQKFSIKQQLEVMVVDLKPDVLCSLAAEINKVMAGSDYDFSTVARATSERHNDCNKKYIGRICEAVDELFDKKKKIPAPVVFLYSHSAEFCQVVLNSLPTTS